MKSVFEVDASARISLDDKQKDDSLAVSDQAVKAVVIGGGTGAPVSIRTLLSMGIKTSAVVAMADDGGSTGILREEADVTPPGDVRKCLVAFARDPDDPLTKAFRYRFDFEKNHALGNLILAALEETSGSFAEAIRICENLLDAQGKVFPSTLDRITLSARTCDGTTLEGQAKASASATALHDIWLEAVEQCRPFDQAMEAIRDADLIVLGPGSLFTSIIPNLLVPGIVDAIKESKAKTLFICSLADMQGETWGLSAKEHVEALCRHGMKDLLDYVLVHSPEQLKPDDVVMGSYHAALGTKTDASTMTATDEELVKATIRPVSISYADVREIQEDGPVVIVRDLVSKNQPTWHDPAALRNALLGVLKLCRLPQT